MGRKKRDMLMGRRREEEGVRRLRLSWAEEEMEDLMDDG